MLFRPSFRRKAYALFLFLTACSVSHSHTATDMPETVDDLLSFFDSNQKTPTDLADGKRYSLPRVFRFGTSLVDSFYINDSHLYLSSSNLDDPGFLFIRSTPSLDTLFTAKDLGSLIEQISPQDTSAWEALQDHSPLLHGKEPTKEAMLIPLSIAFTKGSMIYFVKAIIPLKTSQSPVARDKKSIGDNGPLDISIYATDLFFQNQKATD